MSNAEELLSTLSAGVNASTEPHIIIDADRYITVPDELKRIAVQYDHNVETVTFDCPRYWDGLDMSEMKIYVNYLRSDNEVGAYKATNVVVDDTDDTIMHFDWTISRNVTDVFGQIAFLVCIRKADTEGNEKNHWNSEICKNCRVSEGLEVDEGKVNEIYPDIIEQWYQEVLGIIGEVNTVKQGLIDMRDSGEFNGATFTPNVSVDGELSWSNDKGLTNPATVNLTGPDGISPEITVTDIQDGHRITITDVNGTQHIDVKDTIINTTEAVQKLIDKLFVVGTVEPETGPVLWFETIVPDDYVYTEYENAALAQVKDSVSQLYSRVEALENNSGSGSGSSSDPNVEIDANSFGVCNTFDGGILEFTSDT